MDTFAPAPQKHRSAMERGVFDLIKAELAFVEEEFRAQSSSNIQVIDYLGDYLTASGGKRVRPALLILANYAVGGDGSDARVIRLATVMEMLHTATLVHDDIIDNADVRRNQMSVNSRFGNQTAVLMGDWLYMSAFETTARERSLEIIDILTRLTRKMTEGELIQLTRIGRVDISESDYFDILRRKTAYLFSATCEVGAILAGADAATRIALSEFGLNLGVAFQLFDDILDITGSTESVGKPTGRDLLEGKITLPFIYLLESDPGMRASLEKIMSDGEYTSISRENILIMLHNSGGIERTRELAESHSDRARKSLAVLRQSEYRSSLEEVLHFITDRNR